MVILLTQLADLQLSYWKKSFDIENKIKKANPNVSPEVMSKLEELTSKIKTDFLDKIKSPNT